MKQKSNSLFLAKPSGITLSEHIENVLLQGDAIFNSFPFTFIKYKCFTGKDLYKRLSAAIKYHDDGKKKDPWQKACCADYNTYIEWKEANVGNFSDFSKHCNKTAGQNLRRSGIRHEISSLDMHWDHNFSLPVQASIAAHHSKLSFKHEYRWLDNSSGKNSTALWNVFKNLNAKFRNHNYFTEAVKEHYEYSGVRAFLQLADRRGSALEDNGYIVGFDKFKYEFPTGWEKRKVQQLAEQHFNDELLLLRAPTGSGKTDACLLWAQKQVKHNKAERLIIAMPTRFTSNALSINITETLSSTGLYHSSAWFSKFHKDVKHGVIEKEIARKKHEAARQLIMPVTVCTIDHLLVALTLSREDHHSIVFNLANSCVVIDEADFYDEFTQANILVLLEALKVLSVPVMIMSASLPEASLDMYRNAGFRVNSIIEDTSDNSRFRCEIVEIRDYEEAEDLSDLFELCIEKGQAIIYANTVARAIEFYEWFKDKGVPIIVYHSRFTEPDKKHKEEQLLSMLGKEVWEEGKASGIAILTQIGEMSVNISADIMITETCPIDRLVQRAGRLCRFEKRKVGKLFVVNPEKDGHLYPAPYGEYVPGRGWKPLQSLIKTNQILDCKKYSANDFVAMVNEVYPTFKNFSTKAQQNAVLLKQKFVSNWIIVPREQNEEEDVDMQDWKSRDIAENVSVFVKFPEQEYFYYWQDFQEFKIENSIDISAYLFKIGLKYNRLTAVEITVNNEVRKIYVAINSYSFEYGLELSTQSKEDQFL
ncbi:CRISPR-associated helicase Cas3' [Cruoricaptor ignavus]|uniref:CRISPR-associated helicase Cas3 n=1 Tax=Cruoricaptor ignavus TaxID=1118202 RepID=A0A7M1T2B9_9FLAO|nr:CRISPR-associated helicase Cas3' [Cruoricaptor ignavus]QOR73284.1 CRISPR-associated helicase Cas3' [Cruoricaptor ignavus]